MLPGLEALRRMLGVEPAPLDQSGPPRDYVLQLLSDPVLQLFAALVLGAFAFAPRISMNASRVLFFLAWLVGLYGLHNLPWVQYGLASLALTVGMLALGFWARPESVPLYFGRITPRRRLLFASAGGEIPLLEIGDSGTVFAYAGPQGQALFKFFNEAHLTVELIKGRVMVSTKVTDQNGNAVAEIARNEWRAPPPHAWDRNYTRDAVEVKDARGNIVLQVRALPDRIQLQGEWWGNPIDGVRLVESADPQRPGAQMMIFGRNFRPQPPYIQPMFIYPSETNLGRLAG